MIGANLADYDGFIFTSMFEGMPNVVLEMTSHAIPLILSAVGGLRDTFDEESVCFVDSSEDEDEMAKAFSGKMDAVRALSPAELEIRVQKVVDQVERVHNEDLYAENVLQLFGVQ